MGRKNSSNRSKKGRSSKPRKKSKDVAVEETPAVPEDEVVSEIEGEVEEDIVIGPEKKRKRGTRKNKVIVEDENLIEEQIEEPEQTRPPTSLENDDGKLVWEAVDWEDVTPTSRSGPVFDDGSIKDILKDLVGQAWNDGVISEDEMALLRVLQERLKVDDVTFEKIISDTRPSREDVEQEQEILADETPPEPGHDEEQKEEDEAVCPEPDAPTLIEPPPKMPSDLPQPPPIPYVVEKTPVNEPAPFVEPRRAPPPPIQETRGIITLTSYVRDSKKPLGESFDLTKKEEALNNLKRRCPHCRAMIRVHPEEGRDRCPICGGTVVSEKIETPGIRRLLDQARTAYRECDMSAALELYTLALAQSPQNKEAQFYLQKLHHHPIEKRPVIKGDVRNVTYIPSFIKRLDQLLMGGYSVGSQVLLKGPAFSGKEVVFNKIMASSLSLGIPVIYVSSNRAMKEVMQGIIRQVPEFRRFNQEGLVRMYDLFSKYSDGKVLKEGHRIFNIEDREDFKRFQSDLVYLMEEFVSQFHGGVMIINSLSPLVTRTDMNDLMKFLQVLISRSKSYRFTNIMDMATGVHPESVENSIEYLMDGIIEFRERENRKSLRLRGFHQGVPTREWIDYQHTDTDIHIMGSFQGERIL
ncbi:MAG: hypothetical protein JXA22_10640 [Candidatus Thermoplasmatota archaeon]|nr:hypothetical protein [Candidatus Thermoplasmatota archaeon]